ncbi:hypothetical protein BABINDRAFT_160011 [Babjeviella inositovora NRRL Y-12698]|uniref:ethanolamine kinase n=1 Tax=Babjeviella inositovora NRRL Y-12698 TaxID=984486 RepID=A0A1E3QVT6_9ASCO|nr:uncharacterized protein BABINDRAFT_160011 [Babjeviella inositovora NRRL Y-12698]ODQ81771.1 hypothetical protein BABINDRAFT_160011 [Babjeviella inositovora NRRL Y-12698]
MSSVYCLISSGDLHLLPASATEHAQLTARDALPFYAPAALGDPSQRAALEPPLSSASESTINHILDEYSARSVYLPLALVALTADAESAQSQQQIRDMIVEVFPEWDASQISVARLTGGITNMLLQCTYQQGTPAEKTVLVRTYGKGTDVIIDRDREFISHLVLNSLGLAPPVHARFANGLVYGFLPGRSLSPEELAYPSIYPYIAQTLGHWHRKIHGKHIEQGIRKLKEYNHMQAMAGSLQRHALTNAAPKKPLCLSLWQLIEQWIEIIPQIPQVVESFEENRDLAQDQAHGIDVQRILQQELAWLLDKVGSESFSRTVLSHCDLLSGNVIMLPEGTVSATEEASISTIDQNPVRFIDYEYMLPSPRGFDIANHFAEWQGFDCDKSKIPQPSPQNPVMRKWAEAYLSTSPNVTPANLERKVDRLIEEIHGFYGMPGFYWGIWAAIQSEISIIDFDYAGYSKLRLNEYWEWKRGYQD